MDKEEASNSSTEIQCAGVPASAEVLEKEEPGPINIPEFDNWSKCVIFRVPRKLRDSNEKAYTPHLVSIGPFHHGNKALNGMESHKKNYYFKQFCVRTDKNETHLMSFIRERSDKILDCYAGAIKLDRVDFENMVLIDACFIFELFSRAFETRHNEDYILRTPCLLEEIRLDLLMLENQIPFVFLEELYNFSYPRLGPRQSVCTSNNQGDTDQECCNINIRLLNCLAVSCNSSGCISCKKHESTDEENQGQQPSTFLMLAINFFNKSPASTLDVKKKIRHFTDLVRQLRLPKDGIKTPKHHVTHLYSATKLNEAGIHFARAPQRKGSMPPLARVKERRPWCKYIPCFHSLRLELPLFKIEDSTECILRNVIALEQCLYPFEAFICNYVFLISELIDTEKDLEILVENKIIDNMLGSNKEATDLVNELKHNMSIVQFTYSDEFKELNDFYGRWYNKAKAKLISVYFKDLWTGSSTVVGIFVLIFTTTSTIKSLFFS
ncbi:hypothetical protein TorRG33x02_255760 [Trema orientale]|uniref:Uncharacterized protein n=1 Tax=Trema orientale TaxID=63057 RepID=A0A2P5DC69_TREOI|nr:hypothetical protein TorRG33x02_255760 [Trema orientale]